MASNAKQVLQFPTSEFRSLPIPNHNAPDGSRCKLATFFVRATQLPDALTEWMGVNPRVPVLNKREKMTGHVAKAMIDTLEESPELFVVKNQGIWLLAREVEFKKAEGGGGSAEVVFDDKEEHGVVNGGHTLHAILQALEEVGPEKLKNAYVRLHVLQGIEGSLVTDLAEGLNRSLQVDNPSLANLSGAFDDIKKVMDGKSGADQIAYRQGDAGDIDILDVLTMALMFDLDRFPDRKKHPNVLFGQPKAVLQDFQDSIEKKSFKKILPMLPQILVLSDRVQQVAFKRCGASFGKIKVSSSKNENRAASPKHKSLPAHFAGGHLGGKCLLGFLYPMVAAFRANMSHESWEKGKFEWLMDPEELLPSVIEEMVEVVLKAYEDNNGKPAEVGRKDAAYRLCYSAVSMELAQNGMLADGKVSAA